MKTQQTQVWNVTNKRGATMNVYASDEAEAISLAERNGFGPISTATINRCLTYEENGGFEPADTPTRASHSPLPDTLVVPESELVKFTTYEQYEQVKAHAQRLSDALAKSLDWLSSYPGNGAEKCYSQAREALAQYNESPADADALEVLDQLEQLEGGE